MISHINIINRILHSSLMKSSLTLEKCKTNTRVSCPGRIPRVINITEFPSPRTLQEPNSRRTFISHSYFRPMFRK